MIRRWSVERHTRLLSARLQKRLRNCSRGFKSKMRLCGKRQISSSATTSQASQTPETVFVAFYMNSWVFQMTNDRFFSVLHFFLTDRFSVPVDCLRMNDS